MSKSPSSAPARAQPGRGRRALDSPRGGAHHTAHSLALTAEHFRTFGAMHGVETIEIA
ncbi:MAG: hypothetical protein AAFY08_06000 [Planctomycetota bacterium]